MKRLEDAGEIVYIANGKGRNNLYTIKKDTRNFEMISYELLNSDIFRPELKGFYYRYQGEFIKNDEGAAKSTRTNEEIANKFHMSINTVRKYIKELEELGVLSTGLTKVRDETTGLMRDIKSLNLNTVFQAVLYTHKKVEAVAEDVQEMKKEAINTRKDIEDMRREIRELKKELFTTPVEFEMN